MKDHVIYAAVFGTVIFTVPAAWAGDVGFPNYADADGGSKADIEIYYSDISRDARQQYDVGGEVDVEQEEKRIIVRLNYAFNPRVALYGEVGAVDSYTSDGNEPLFGAGLKMKLYDGDFFDLSGFISGTYIPEIEYHDEMQEDDGRPFRWFQEESYTELGAGLIVSRQIPLVGNMVCTPYGGLMASKIYGDEDYTLYYYREQTVGIADGYVEEDSPFSVFAGLGLALNDSWGLRFEGRFVNQTSLSGGLTYSF